jgi:hypothetical protein
MKSGQPEKSSGGVHPVVCAPVGRQACAAACDERQVPLGVLTVLRVRTQRYSVVLRGTQVYSSVLVPQLSAMKHAASKRRQARSGQGLGQGLRCIALL